MLNMKNLTKVNKVFLLFRIVISVVSIAFIDLLTFVLMVATFNSISVPEMKTCAVVILAPIILVGLFTLTDDCIRGIKEKLKETKEINQK